MREILCRGESVDYGLVEGYYVRLVDSRRKLESHRIYEVCSETDCGDFYPDFYEVDPSTICQYTGMKDKYNEEIWEGDIVEYKEKYGRIEWDDGDGMYLAVFDGWCVNFSQIWSTETEVIGNIHDNPELLERVSDGEKID